MKSKSGCQGSLVSGLNLWNSNEDLRCEDDYRKPLSERERREMSKSEQTFKSQASAAPIQRMMEASEGLKGEIRKLNA
jgi:hypothetical protein